MATKPSIPKGTRDFGPVEMLRRKYIFSTIERVFQKYGYLPLETPAMENLETLTGKYGEEGDRLIFKILKRGAELERALEDRTRGFADEALRYDLTVPFARYVVQHQNELAFPFKRYQIQPVWRADRPQKGRYREFYQCDADVIGSTSLLSEVELVCIIQEVFESLSLKVKVHVNNRKILLGLVQLFEVTDRRLTSSR
ncbi:MAG: ATP phosphoribosyltransferase regulatory subunit [Flavobacteriales bacterium]|nr:ATP phosphoribosyltransferase regulatory subunit [Flavobacteriales bacterium]